MGKGLKCVRRSIPCVCGRAATCPKCLHTIRQLLAALLPAATRWGCLPPNPSGLKAPQAQSGPKTVAPGGVREETWAAKQQPTQRIPPDKSQACHLQTLRSQQLSSPGSCDLELRRPLPHLCSGWAWSGSLSPGC